MIVVGLSILTLNILWSACRAIPLIDLKGTLEQNVLQPIDPPDCSINGGCWGWLPVQDVQENVAIVPENLAISRLHTRRQTASADSTAGLEPWNDSVSTLEQKLHSPSPSSRQIGNRVTKKDVLLSRSWGAGGMPFSVLYMSPHGLRGNHASSTQQQDVGKTNENSTPSIGNPNYRIALRNGASGQPRRQYSMIPQLFISYGWGPFGK